jgi:hypothetical protein
LVSVSMSMHVVPPPVPFSRGCSSAFATPVKSVRCVVRVDVVVPA